MNHLPTVIWNAVLGHGVRWLGRSTSLARHPTALAVLLVFAGSVSVRAADLPAGHSWAEGRGTVTTSGAKMTIKQTDDKAIINWQSFNVGQDKSIEFQQPDQKSVALNRVIGKAPSLIDGQLKSNGQVFLVNPNGVLFGQTAKVDVGSLVASTLDIHDSAFFAGSYQFHNQGNANGVINNGNITAAAGGAVALLGGRVSNNGVISARLGSVILAAGNEIMLEFMDGGFLRFVVQKSVLNALVENHQLIEADGGSVIMQVKATDALLQTVINNTGVIRARAVEKKSGTIFLLGGFDGGKVLVSGTLDANANEGGNGGRIFTQGSQIQILNDAKVSANGENGSWTISAVSGLMISADSLPKGSAVGAAALMSSLATNNVLLLTTGTNIYVNAPVSWGVNILSLNAKRDINVNAVMTANATAGLEMNYGNYFATRRIPDEDSGLTMAFSKNGFSGRVDFKGENALGASTNHLSINGNNYTILTQLGSQGSTTAQDLQGINGRLNGKYALGADINASTTGTWNGGRGFSPIGARNAPFTGQVEGLGHQISGLFIRRSDEDNVGIFGHSQGDVRNLKVTGGRVLGRNQVGSLVGYMDRGSIKNAFASVNVLGGENIGGLVGHMEWGSISKAFSTEEVAGSRNTGGLVGRMSWGSIDNSYTTGNVSVDFPGENGGGLVGRQQGGSISDVYATGDVRGGDNIGGLIGKLDRAILANGYATGKVMGSKGTTGGLVGQSDGGRIQNAYWSIETTGQKLSAGGKGLTMEQMFDSRQWAGFDFVSVWGNSNQQTTPYLRNMAGNKVFNKNDLPKKPITVINRPILYTIVP